MEAEKAALPADAAPGAITIDVAQLRGANGKIEQLILDLLGMSCGSTDDPIQNDGGYTSPGLIVWCLL